MYPVPADFHSLITSSGVKTRVRIYFVDGTVDYTDDEDVVANGTLLAMPGDTDSNGRIQQNGLTINEFFNSGTNVSIGATVSSQVDMTIFNNNGDLNAFTFGRCKIYLDAYDETNDVWLTCPLGVYNIDIPKRRKVQLISAGGYDLMQSLDAIADSWWNGLSWGNGVTISDMIQSLASTLGLTLSANTLSNLPNASLSFSAPPFNSVEMTYREVMTYITEATGTIARFDRDGCLDLRWFSPAQIDSETVTIPADGANNPCIVFDIAEYTVAAIDALNVKATGTDVGVTVGGGGNAYSIINNPLLGGATEEEITNKATPIYNKLVTLPAFAPIQMKVVADCSIEAGDIVNVLYGGNNYPLPIFQQKLNWRGGYVFSDIISSGDTVRPTVSGPVRKEFRTAAQLHEFEVTIDQLRSLIQDINGNYSLIKQTVDSIQQVIATQNVTIQNILDPTGEIWTAIQTNSTNLGAIENALNAEITERKSYIRFIPAEPAIVLGVDTGNEIKLKLVNNRIWFFNGDDDSTDLSQAFAYFNSEEAFADRFVAKNSVQIGTSDDANHWLWKKLDNGDLVLDLV